MSGVGRSNDGRIDDEEDWPDDNGWDVEVSEDDSWIQNPLSRLPKDINSSKDQVVKRRSTKTGGERKRGRGKVVTANMVPIKQEQPDEVAVNISSTAATTTTTTTVPMTILPSGAHPQIPLYTNSLISQPPEPLAVIESSIGGTTIKNEPSEDKLLVPLNVEEGCKTVDSSSIVLVADQTLRSSEVVSSTVGTSAATYKDLKNLSEYLLELNKKNLEFMELRQKLREEYEQRMTETEEKMKQTEQEIDRVLLQMQNLKKPMGTRGETVIPSQHTTS